MNLVSFTSWFGSRRASTFSQIAGLSLAAMLPLTLACFDAPALFVVLVDQSASFAAADSATVRASKDAVIAAARPGDRIVIAGIGAGNVSDFRIAREFVLPRTFVSENDREARDSIGLDLQEAASKLLSSGGTKVSNVLDAVSGAGELMQRHPGSKKHLIILCDMIHETRDLNFAVQRIDSAMIARVIRERRDTGLLPDLTGVRVHVAAAGGRSDQSESYFVIRRFWEGYFKAAGASIDSAWYGRSAISSIR